MIGPIGIKEKAVAMKYTIPLMTKICVVLLLSSFFSTASAVEDRESPTTPATKASSTDDKVYHTRLRIDSAEGIRVAEIEGKVRFSQDNSSIEWMSEGAFLRLVVQENEQRIRLGAEPNKQGQPVFRYEIDGHKHPYDQSAEQWLANTLPVMFRELGYGVDSRVQAAYEQGGSVGVLHMISTIRSDYSTKQHYAEYLNRSDLSDNEIIAALSHIGQDVNSDNELAAILYAATDLYQNRPGIRQSYLACLDQFNSDIERSRISQNLFGIEYISGDAPLPLNTTPGGC